MSGGGVFFDGKMRETRFRAPKPARLRLLRLWGQRARRSASAPAAVATRRERRDGQRPRKGLGFSLGIGFAGDGEGGKELQKVTESPQQKGINGNKKKRGREGAGQRPAGTAGGLFALLLGNGEGFASLPQSSAPNAGFGARAARFAGPLPRCQACHFCPCSPQEGFGDSPPMASSCLGWGQLRTAVLSPLGALPRGDRWLKALGIQQSGRKWEKMGAEGGGQAPAGLSPSLLQEADAPDQ